MSFLDIRTAIAQGADLLARAQVSEPRLTAQLLLCHALGGKDRSWLFAHPEQRLSELQWIHYGRYLHERMRGKPLQYITRTQEFFARAFKVSPDVLIPRPETEILVETAIKAGPRKLAIDVGTGSGAIAVTLALESESRVIATDVSCAALAVAHSNARRHRAAVQFVAADLLAPFADASADLIVSNPPYVPELDRDFLQREVREWEPHVALFAGASGLDVYRRLIPEAARVLKPGGLLVLEIGFGQVEAVMALSHTLSNGRVIPDLAGIPRVLACEKP